MIKETDYYYHAEFFRQPTETLKELEEQRDKAGESLEALEARIVGTEHFTFETATEIAVNHIFQDGQFSEASVRIAFLEQNFSKVEDSLKHVMLMDFNTRLAAEGLFVPMKIYLEDTADQQFTLAQMIDHKQGSQKLTHLGNKYREMTAVIPDRGQPLDIIKLLSNSDSFS